jgi:FKBP-type peptidyl-prolyl cis-trans isomerase FkpA
VVPCWTEGMQKMKVGGKAQLVCPSTIAYGDTGHPPTIPGGSTLIFTVELLDILPPGATPPMPPGHGMPPGVPGMMHGPPPGPGGRMMPPPGGMQVHPMTPPPQQPGANPQH